MFETSHLRLWSHNQILRWKLYLTPNHNDERSCSILWISSLSAELRYPFDLAERSKIPPWTTIWHSWSARRYNPVRNIRVISVYKNLDGIDGITDLWHNYGKLIGIRSIIDQIFQAIFDRNPIASKHDNWYHWTFEWTVPVFWYQTYVVSVRIWYAVIYQWYFFDAIIWERNVIDRNELIAKIVHCTYFYQQSEVTLSYCLSIDTLHDFWLHWWIDVAVNHVVQTLPVYWLPNDLTCLTYVYAYYQLRMFVAWTLCTLLSSRHTKRLLLKLLSSISWYKTFLHLFIEQFISTNWYFS